MAVAEARAAWQRTANRCFVQEDAKRAPKLACCQSSSTSKQIDSGPVNAPDETDCHTIGFIPINRNPSYSNLPPDIRWWLQIQPDDRYYKGLTREQVNAIEAESETLKPENVNSASKLSDIHPHENESSFDMCDDVSAVSANKETEVKKQEVKMLLSTNSEEFVHIDNAKGNYGSVEMDTFDCEQVSKHANELNLDPDSPWIGHEKSEPWWRTTDRDELAYLVARKSLDCIENCDLPPPQKLRRHPYARKGCYEYNKISTMDSIPQTVHISGVNHDFGRKQGVPVEQGDSQTFKSNFERGRSYCIPSPGSEKSFSCTDVKDFTTSRPVSEGDTSKAELMEALRHSQTRAREADIAAKKANAEKEHIVQLFFRQASQLFAYKQWLQMLQLETLYMQIKNNDKQISTSFPVVLPWMFYRTRKPRKNWPRFIRGKRIKRGRMRYDISKYAFAYAFGLGLVGAGLLLGWTVGWMLPPF